MTSTLRTNAALTARNKPLTGDTKSSFVLDDHMGWLKCDGRLLDRTTYNLLFQVIGTTFGTTDATNFKLPDLQGRVMGNSGQVTDDVPVTQTFAPGTSQGEIAHKLIQLEMPSHNHDTAGAQVNLPTGTTVGNTSTQAAHTHGITDPGHSHLYSTPDGNQSTDNIASTEDAADADRSNGTTAPANTGITINPAGAHNHTIASNGGDGFHNNIQPTLFYGNTFIYCGIPISTHGVSAGIFPYTVARNPVLI
jgi:microcystin-dependent protein